MIKENARGYRARPVVRDSRLTEPSANPAAPSQSAEMIERWIGEHPALCVGLAAAMGVTIGWLIKRR